MTSVGAHVMKGTICIAAIAALIGTPALAADMAVKTPSPAPTPVYNWTGWYVGANLGASFGRAKTDFNVAPVTVTTLGGGPSINVPGLAGSALTEPSGFIGGGQIGYNWQYSPLWVVGLEADFQGALERESFATPISSFGFPFATTHTHFTDNIIRLGLNYQFH
jgi:outer membrane immunogenic protein